MRRLALAVLVAMLPALAPAQGRVKPIRVIVATGVGGTADVFMRVLGEEYHRRFGRPFVIETRAGGNMNIGGRACAEAPNDGSTICNLPNAALTYNQFLYKKLPYDPERFEPITNPFFNTQLMVVSTALRVNSFDELAALSKAKPGTLSYAVPSEPLSVFMDWWKARTGADMVRVPFKGGGDSVNSMLSGATPVAIFGIGNWLPHVAAGTVRPLMTYFALVAPPGTPQPIIAQFYEQVAAIGRDPEFRRKRLVEVGLEPVFDPPDVFARFLKEDRARAGRIVKAAGLVPQ